METLRNRARWTSTSRAPLIWMCAMLLGAASAAPLAAHASPTHAASQIALSGSAVLKPGASVQFAGSLQLKATLSAPASAAAVQQGAGYAMSAKLAAEPLVCTDDTIFENGFEM